MISNYEIRENTLTKNSVFLLLLKADQQGCEDIQQGLSGFCNLTDIKVKGFNYVFELSGITDDSMLEKIRYRLESLSSTFQGETQTFGNALKTSTFTVGENTSTNIPRINMTSTNLKRDYKPEDIFVNTVNESINLSEEQQKSVAGIPAVSLAKTGFTVDKTREDTSFDNLIVDNKYSDGETKISLEGESLKLVQTVSDIKKPEKKESLQQEVSAIPPQENKTAVEEENKTIVSFTSEDIKDVSISIEPEQKGFLKNMFGKIKSAIKNKKADKINVTQEKQKTNEHQKLSASLKQENKVKQNFLEPKQTEETQKQDNAQQPLQPKENPFQNLGSGIIVKKGLLNSEELSEETKRQLKEDLSENSLTAKLQVDDIFDAETVCEFYADQPEEKKGKTSFHGVQETSPLEKLENTVAPKQQMPLPKEKTSPELLQKNISAKKEVLPKGQGKEDLTSPAQIFTQSKTKAETKDIEPKTENNIQQQKPKNIVSDSKKVSAVSSAKKEEVKKQETKQEEKQENKEASFRIVSIKESRAISKNKQETSKVEPKKEEKTTTVNTVKKGEGENMQTPKQNMFNQVQTNHQSISENKEKIDHTLHVATPSKETKYKNYPIEMPLIPTYTFANMDISSIRFAHAMAMVTLDNLGTTNNPFLLQGESGTGKTHFLNAMGYEISKKIPQAKILFTNGVRLSRGVQYLLERGKKDKLDEFFNNAEVLIVDDVHLTAVNEHNREYISKVLNDFLQNKKQIILSSKYPPESLKRFEELVNFKFSMGTIAEVKVPGKDHFAKLTNKIVTNSFLNLTDNQIQEFFIGHNKSLGEVAIDVKRVKVLSRRIESSGIKKMSYEDLLKVMTAVEGENQESEIVKKDFSDVTSLEKNKENTWGSFGFFFPTSQIDKFRWVAFAAQEAAKELGIRGGFNYALKSAYSTEHIISSAFKIANICDLKGLKGAIILGPSLLESKEPIRNNFYDILSHMLEVMMIRCGTINFEDIKKPSAYVKMLGDILK